MEERTQISEQLVALITKQCDEINKNSYIEETDLWEKLKQLKYLVNLWQELSPLELIKIQDAPMPEEFIKSLKD